ncbi:hypothetical protein EVAR_21192_1 [Eumeta japonica]|uniref:Uncharacterized protein n=1 Tax=Eumeta variegata TaxID=151549 RepID=A0A4C1UQ12_EUMVA|nr:hypothetical protein EVAR_21192_1 [Eumeta japonica]
MCKSINNEHINKKKAVACAGLTSRRYWFVYGKVGRCARAASPRRAPAAAHATSAQSLSPRLLPHAAPLPPVAPHVTHTRRFLVALNSFQLKQTRLRNAYNFT